jgi:Rieske Fe-S protein
MEQMNRRELLVAAAATACLCALGDPQTLLAATTGPLDIGPLTDYKADGITSKWIASEIVSVVRNKKKLYAHSAKCTHRGCTIRVDPGAPTYTCPCHHAGFDLEGKVTRPPARTSLVRYAIAVDDKGHVIVDRSKQFTDAQWTDPASFIDLSK